MCFHYVLYTPHPTVDALKQVTPNIIRWTMYNQCAVSLEGECLQKTLWNRINIQGLLWKPTLPWPAQSSPEDTSFKNILCQKANFKISYFLVWCFILFCGTLRLFRFGLCFVYKFNKLGFLQRFSRDWILRWL